MEATVTELKRRIEALTAENGSLREENRRLGERVTELENPPEFVEEEHRILEFLARSGQPLDLSTIGYKLKMRPTRVAFFIERLHAANIVGVEAAAAGRPMIVRLDAAGREYAIRNQVV
jgi:hypothetical protein